MSKRTPIQVPELSQEQMLAEYKEFLKLAPFGTANSDWNIVRFNYLKEKLKNESLV